jgi:hypothetical protein
VSAAAGEQAVSWPALPDGSYVVTLSIADEIGTFVKSLPLVVDTTPPKVTVISYASLRFRISEPAQLTLVVGTRRFTRVLKQAGTTQFRLRVKPTRYTLLVTDDSGNTTTVRYRR